MSVAALHSLCGLLVWPKLLTAGCTGSMRTAESQRQSPLGPTPLWGLAKELQKDRIFLFYISVLLLEFFRSSESSN